jgi:hypothetical protein
VGAAVELHQFAEASGTHAALAMSRSTAFAREPRPFWRSRRRSVSRLREKPSRSTNFSQRWWSLKPA